VRAQLEKGSSLSTKTMALSSQPSGPFGYLQGFYEGGKKGYGFERQEEVSDVCNKAYVNLRLTLTSHLAGLMKGKRTRRAVKTMAQRGKSNFLTSTRSR